MSWQILITISLFANVTQTLLQRTLLKDVKSNPAVYLIISNLIAAVFLLIPGLFVGFKFANLIPFIPNILISSTLIGTGALFWFKSLKLIEASEFVVLFASRSFWIIIAAVILLGEHFSLIQAFGALLIFLAVYLASWKTKKFRLGKGETYALLGAAFFGLGIISDSIILQKVDSTTYLPIGFFSTATFVWITNFKLTPQIIAGFKSSLLPKFTILAFASGLTAFTYLTAYQVGRNAAQIAAINQLSTILIVIAGIIFLKERDRLGKKILAALISFAGVLLIK